MSDLKLTRQRIIAFALPAIPISALGLPLVVYVPPFYSELGLSLSVVGNIFALARFWDLITDPVLGTLSDRWTTQIGRRRPWIILSVPLLMASAYALFLPEQPVSASYLLTWLILLYVGYTMLSISHMSWGAELSDDYHDRARVQGWREFSLIFGMLAVLAIPAVMQQTQNANSTTQVGAMGWFVVVTLPITIVVSVWKVPERPTPPQSTIGFVKSAKILARNRLLQRVLGANFLTGLAPGVTGSIYIFFISDVMALPDWSSAILLMYFLASLIGVPGWIWLSCRLGKHQTFMVAMVWMALVLPLLLLVPPGSLWLNILVNALYGVTMGASPFLLRSILADVTDWDNLESGSQRTGLYYSLLMMSNKFGYALAVGVTYPLLDWIGYSPDLQNTPETLMELKLLFIFAPILAILPAAALLWRFPLNVHAQQMLRQQLIERDVLGGGDR
ncbi:MFS transporter [Phormidium yuhuli AB48]|uniref:MFS transporter n=1 Tax=Phormidium yuhuli AB48 TaxID=2940671 RepID=A0ABY5AKX9_9CYAN|nr:MFS transporter [Phormidium yuhuli]USR89421.1 MFS transporter [Phormidium yuhuli AB48]